MKKNDLRARFREWDEDAFDLTEAAAGPMHPATDEVRPAKAPSEAPVARVERSQVRAFRHTYPVLSVILLTAIIVFLLATVIELPPFGSAHVPANNEVIERYTERGMEETGAVNVVAGVILDDRAFDTLGESHVLYTAVTAVLILMLSAKEVSGLRDPREEFVRKDPLVRTTAMIVVPAVILFGVYVILNGHLGPGGGFSGGALIGAGLILYAMACGFERIERFLNLKSFRVIVLAALSFYSLSKCYSFFCGANHLESGITAGVPGRILSAGLILPLNAAVGIVVACTMYGFYSVFTRGRI